MNNIYENNNKPVTCAMVLADKDGSILACHATGRPSDRGYDFPKGIREPGESDLEAAKRELYEETGIVFDTYPWAGSVQDLGTHYHNRYKDIHIFMCPVTEFPDVSGLVCRSYFERNGAEIPEMDGHRVIKKGERNLLNHVLQDKFELIDSALHDFHNEK